MKICPNCKTESSDDSCVCIACGKEFPIIAENDISKNETEPSKSRETILDYEYNNPVLDNTTYRNNLNMLKEKITQKTNFDFVLYPILGIISIILVFCEGFFQYSYHYDLANDKYGDAFGSFTELIENFSLGTLIIGLLIIAMITLIIYSLIEFFKDKHIEKFNIVCSGIALGCILIGSIGGQSSYGFSSSENVLGFSFGFQRKFISFGLLFYVELLILGGLLAISLLNYNNKYILNKK